MKMHRERSKAVNSSNYNDQWIESAWGNSTAEYIKSGGDNLRPRVKHAIDIAELKPGMKVLDIGCGRGEVVLYCARQGCQGEGIDYSSSILDIAQLAADNLPDEVKKRVTFILGDVSDLTISPKTYDRIFLLDVVEHLQDWQLLPLLQTVHRILKDDGILVVHTLPNRWIYKTYSTIRHIIPLLPKDIRSEYEKNVHINEQSCLSIKKLLENTNFTASVRVEQELTGQAEWYKSTLFNDRRDKIYKIFRNPIIKLAIKTISTTPLRLFLMNDIYAIAGKNNESIEKFRFKQGIHEKISSYIFTSSW